MKGGSCILVAIIIFVSICLTIVSSYSLLQAKIAPLLVCGLILILALVELIRELRGDQGRASDRGSPQAETMELYRDYLREAGWMAGFFIMIYLLGFLISIALFTAAYAKAHKAGWTIAIMVGLSMATLSYLLFSYLVDTELYPGLIYQQLGPTS